MHCSLEGHDSCNSLSQTLLSLLLLSSCRVLMRLLLCTRTCPYTPLLLLYTLCRAICSLSNIFWHSAHNCNLFSPLSLSLSVVLRCCSLHYYSVLVQGFCCCCSLSLYLLLLLLWLLSSPRLVRVSEAAEHVDEFSISIGLAVHV